MSKLATEEQQQQEYYRDARFSKQYDGIWQSVGKCVFCDLRDKYIFFEENGIALTITLYAYIDGHMMIVPRRHITSAKELTVSEWQTIRKCLYIAKKLIKQVHHIEGMQLVQKDGAVAQSTVEHIHFHAIPFDAADLCTWNYRKLDYTPLENATLYRQAEKTIRQLSRKFDAKYAHSAVATTSQLPETDAVDANLSKPTPPNEDINTYVFRWSDLAFGDKKPINRLNATFLAAPRELSKRRFTEIVKQFLPTNNLVVGIADEDYILGFENQAQFKTLRLPAIKAIVDKVNSSASRHKIYVLHYSQRDLPYLADKLRFREILFVNGSWKLMFHIQPIYYKLTAQQTPFQLISPFCDEAEAKDFYQRTDPVITSELDRKLTAQPVWSEYQLLTLVEAVASQSYDYSFQTGAILAQKILTAKPAESRPDNTNKASNQSNQPATYRIMSTGFNRVVPFPTYALHHGASREKYFSPPNDLNHYDAIHAEVDLVIQAQKQGIDLEQTSLFINLLPCPNCAMMLAETNIHEIVYRIDHSDGYALNVLEQAGKTVRRLVNKSV